MTVGALKVLADFLAAQYGPESEVLVEIQNETCFLNGGFYLGFAPRRTGSEDASPRKTISIILL